MNVVNTDPEEAARKEAERLQRQRERQEQARLKREAAQREQETTSNQRGQDGPQPSPESGRKGTPLLYTDESVS